MKNMLKKIKHWFWWKFIATDEDKLWHDLFKYGVALKTRDGKRVRPTDFYLK